MRVHLRQRQQTKKGKISLYLEIYKGTTSTKDGKTKTNRDYEYLELYLIAKPKTPFDIQHNKETLELAKSIKAKREFEIKNGQYGFDNTFKAGGCFIEYYKVQMNKRIKSRGNYTNWGGMLKHILIFTEGGQLSFENIDEAFCKGLLNYLQNEAKTTMGKPLKQSSVHSYYTKFKACIHQAVRDKIIHTNPCLNVKNVGMMQAKREWLTESELRKIAKTHCQSEILKRSFLFSCFTGLRWSDIHKLKWSEVQKTDTGTRIVFHQQKTKGLQYLDINEQACKYMGDVRQPDELVFWGLNYNNPLNDNLRKWMLDAGITKNITFHCARHTFAVLLLSKGVEIYTVSKLLGHTDIKTTQIYASITDAKKREAMDLLPNFDI